MTVPAYTPTPYNGPSGGNDKPSGGRPKSPSRNRGTSTTSSSGDGKERKRFMQSYLQVIYGLYGRMNFTAKQQALANRAYANRFSASAYLTMLRRSDPRYARSDDYKKRVREAQSIYEMYRGYGVKTPFAFQDKYARSELNARNLHMKIQETPWFKQRFPDWKQAVNSGIIGQMGEQSAQAYLSMRDMLNNAFRSTTGSEADPRLHRMMFSAGMSEDDVARNLLDVFGGQEALRWATGKTMDTNEILRSALTKQYGTAGLGRIAASQRTQAGFMKSSLRPFDIGVDESSGNLVSSRI